MVTSELTIVITTFKSDKVIEECLSSIGNKYRVIIIENSSDLNFKRKIESNHTNVECFLTDNNLGYAKANNLGLAKVKTKYALILNPDTIVKNNALENFLMRVKEIPDFYLMGPMNDQQLNLDPLPNETMDVENLKGFAIFINLAKFNQSFFDENYFLYFEEIDFCKRVREENGRIILDSKIVIKHNGAKSVETILKHELEKNRNWHWMWSTFYYHKKYKGFIIAFFLIFPKLISSILKYILFTLVKNKQFKEIYYCRLSGIINSLLGKKSWYRPTLD